MWFFLEKPECVNNANKSNLEKYRNNIKKLELPFTFQYDGFTKVLKAKAKVIPNVKYHFKLGISDVGDQLYDSAIFLEANSLRSIGKKKTLAEKIHNINDQLSIDFNITFEVASDKIIENDSYKLLDDIIKELLKHNDLKIEIIGHTDDTGTFNYNELLSVKRAKTVSSYFISKSIDPSRIKIKGVGATQPKSNMKSENRRVEIVFIKKSN